MLQAVVAKHVVGLGRRLVECTLVGALCQRAHLQHNFVKHVVGFSGRGENLYARAQEGIASRVGGFESVYARAQEDFASRVGRHHVFGQEILDGLVRGFFVGPPLGSGASLIV